MNMKIGNTPMIKIKYNYNEKENYIYTKLEAYNITGSIKDRVAYYILNKAYEEGSLKKGMEIVEATSGNTGIAIAALGAIFRKPSSHFYARLGKQRKNEFNENVWCKSNTYFKRRGRI